MLLLRTGQHDHRYRLNLSVAFDLTQHFKAAHLRQIQIQQDDLRLRLGFAPGVTPGAKKELQRLGAIPRDGDRIGQVRRLQGIQRQFHVASIIFHQKNVADTFRRRVGSARRRRKQSRNGNIQTLGQFFNAGQGKVARPALDIGHVSPMQSGALGQLLLRNTQALPPDPDRRAKSRFNVYH